MDLGSRKLFLSSNSVYKNLNYLEHSAEGMVDFLGDVSRIVFIPYPLHLKPETLKPIVRVKGTYLKGLSKKTANERKKSVIMCRMKKKIMPDYAKPSEDIGK